MRTLRYLPLVLLGSLALSLQASTITFTVGPNSNSTGTISVTDSGIVASDLPVNDFSGPGAPLGIVCDTCTLDLTTGALLNPLANPLAATGDWQFADTLATFALYSGPSQTGELLTGDLLTTIELVNNSGGWELVASANLTGIDPAFSSVAGAIDTGSSAGALFLLGGSSLGFQAGTGRGEGGECEPEDGQTCTNPALFLNGGTVGGEAIISGNSVVPEPASLSLIGIGLLGLGLWRSSGKYR